MTCNNRQPATGQSWRPDARQWLRERQRENSTRSVSAQRCAKSKRKRTDSGSQQPYLLAPSAISGVAYASYLVSGGGRGRGVFRLLVRHGHGHANDERRARASRHLKPPSWR